MVIPWSVGGLLEDVEGSAVDLVGEAIAEVVDGAVVVVGDMEVETKRAFVDRVYEELLVSGASR